jgi:hypothetical protein
MLIIANVLNKARFNALYSLLAEVNYISSFFSLQQ